MVDSVSNCQFVTCLEDCMMYCLYVGRVELVGSTYFAAPEVLLHQSYSRAADVWSVGVMMYLLLCGHLPFDGDELCESICQGAFDVRIASGITVSAFRFYYSASA